LAPECQGLRKNADGSDCNGQRILSECGEDAVRTQGIEDLRFADTAEIIRRVRRKPRFHVEAHGGGEFVRVAEPFAVRPVAFTLHGVDAGRRAEGEEVQ